MPEPAHRNHVEVKRYARADGWLTRYWAVYLEGRLLAVVVYKKGAMAIAETIETLARGGCQP